VAGNLRERERERERERKRETILRNSVRDGGDTQAGGAGARGGPVLAHTRNHDTHARARAHTHTHTHTHLGEGEIETAFELEKFMVGLHSRLDQLTYINNHKN